MEQANFNELLDQFITGTITPEGKQQFLQYLDQPAHRAALEATLQEAMLTDKYLLEIAPQQTDRFITKLSEKMQQAKETPVKQMPFRRWWAAAAILLLIGTGTYLMLRHSPVKTPVATNTPLPEGPVPGKEGAILTLNDGSKVVLDSLGNGVVATQNGARVLLDNGKLAYDAAKSVSAGISYNTMTTPRGRQFRLVLPDGTGVWLNAASSIRYPTTFTGKERKVEITGEAYLEVTKNAAMPFKVKLPDATEIEVLGTSFNINAYHDETSTVTTLIKGAVKVTPRNVKAVILKPGYEARQKKNGGELSVRAANEEQVLSWKNGNFHFDHADIRTIMRQVARWYNIDVEYKDVPVKRFSGNIPRSVNVSQLFKILELTGNVHFNIEGNKVTVRS